MSVHTVYISYRKRQRYTADQVSERMTALGLSLAEPGDAEFTDGGVKLEMLALSDAEKYDDIATLVKGEYRPDVMIAWAKLAASLALSVTITDYSGFKIRALKPEGERYERALAVLKSREMTARRDAAIISLLADDGIKPEDPDE